MQAPFLHWNNEITFSSYSTVTEWIHSFSSFDFKLIAFCYQFRSIASNRISSSHDLSSCLQQTLTQNSTLEKNICMLMFPHRLYYLPVTGLNMRSFNYDRKENNECTGLLSNLILQSSRKIRDKPGTLKNVQSTPSFKPFRSGAHISDRVALGCFSPAGNKEEFLLLF